MPPTDAEIRQAKFDQIRRGSGQRKIVTPPPKLELPEAMHKRFPELREKLEDYHRLQKDYFAEQLGITFNE